MHRTKLQQKIHQSSKHQNTPIALFSIVSSLLAASANYCWCDGFVFMLANSTLIGSLKSISEGVFHFQLQEIQQAYIERQSYSEASNPEHFREELGPKILTGRRSSPQFGLRSSGKKIRTFAGPLFTGDVSQNYSIFVPYHGAFFKVFFLDPSNL